MKQRQHHQLYRVGTDARRNTQVYRVIEIHTKGDHRALWMACCARGVHDHGDIIQGALSAMVRTCQRSQGLLICAGCIFCVEQQTAWHAAQTDQLLRSFGKLGIVDEHLGGRIAQNVLQLWHGKTPVQRNTNGTDL